MWLTNLPGVLRAAGLTVKEDPGWATRTDPDGKITAVRSIICHHTAGPATGELPSLATVRDGRPGLMGPLAHLMLGRSGTWYVIAAGYANHVGVSIDQTVYSNSLSIGIEAEATGTSTWPAVQMASYVAGCKALADAYKLPVSRIRGHKEVASPLGRKVDPNFDMRAFRARIATATTQGAADMPLTDAEIIAISDNVWNRFKLRDSNGDLVTLQGALSYILQAVRPVGDPLARKSDTTSARPTVQVDPATLDAAVTAAVAARLTPELVAEAIRTVAKGA